MKKDKLYSPITVTGVGTLDYAALLEPKLPLNAKDDAVKFFNAQVFFDSEKPLEKLKAEIEKIAEQLGKPLSELDSFGIRTGEKVIEMADKPENKSYLQGKWVISAKTAEERRPLLFKYEAETKSKIQIKDPEEVANLFYRGAKVSVSVTATNYKLAGKVGINLYLNNVMFVAHGTRLGGATGNEFEGVDLQFTPDPDADMV